MCQMKAIVKLPVAAVGDKSDTEGLTQVWKLTQQLVFVGFVTLLRQIISVSIPKGNLLKQVTPVHNTNITLGKALKQWQLT